MDQLRANRESPPREASPGLGGLPADVSSKLFKEMESRGAGSFEEVFARSPASGAGEQMQSGVLQLWWALIQDQMASFSREIESLRRANSQLESRQTQIVQLVSEQQLKVSELQGTVADQKLEIQRLVRETSEKDRDQTKTMSTMQTEMVSKTEFATSLQGLQAIDQKLHHLASTLTEESSTRGSTSPQKSSTRATSPQKSSTSARGSPAKVRPVSATVVQEVGPSMSGVSWLRCTQRERSKSPSRLHFPGTTPMNPMSLKSTVSYPPSISKTTFPPSLVAQPSVSLSTLVPPLLSPRQRSAK